MFMVGQALHIFWNKIPAFKKRCAAANKPFSFKEMIADDYHVIIGLQFFAAAVLIGLDQLVHFKPWLMEYTKWLLWLVGAYGSSVAFQKYSQYDKKLNDFIDKQANFTSAMLGNTGTAQEVVNKSADQYGVDATLPPSTK
jgi:hypothetical protein